MPRKQKPPELTFQQHVADYLVRELAPAATAEMR